MLNTPKKIVKVFLAMLVFFVAVLPSTVGKAAETETLPKVAAVVMDNVPFVVGDVNKLYITTTEYTGMVQYEVLYTSPNKEGGDTWHPVGEETEAVEATGVTEIDLTPLELPSGEYKFNVRVKRAGIEGSLSDEFGTYDHKLDSTVNVVGEGVLNLDGNVISGEGKYTTQDHFIFSGFLRDPEGTQYQLNLYDVNNHSWLMGATPYADQIDFDLSELTPGKYIAIVWYKNGTGRALYDGWKAGAFEVTAPTEIQVVHFEDANLEAAVRRELYKPEGDITSVDMQNLSYLQATSRGITSLVGLEYATNLEEVYLSDNALTDLTPLKNLKKLIKVDLSKNELTEVTPLSNLMEMTTLYLNENQITDLNALENHENLTALYVYDNPVTDLEVLRSLPNIRVLHFGKNNAVSLDIVECLPYLSELRWADTNLEDISVLSGLLYLQKLELMNNQIEDLTPLSNLKQLIQLYVDGNIILDLQPLVENVQNGGFKKSVFATVTPKIHITNNYLDLSENSNNYEDIEFLKGKGVKVYATPQKERPRGLYMKMLSPKSDFKGFTSGRDANVTFRAMNFTKIDLKATLIVAIYDAENRFINYAAVNQDIAAGEYVELSASLRVLKGAAKVKCFVWDDFSNMNPLTPVVEFPVFEPLPGFPF